MTNDRLDPITGRRIPGDPSAASSTDADQLRPGPSTTAPGEPASGAAGGTADRVHQVAHRAVDEATAVKETALGATAEVKDAVLDRVGDVTDTAKDELNRLAADARTQFQGLWTEASGQLVEQARSGQHQLAELVHSLADELGVMASRSGQDGPLTSLAQQAAQRGGAFSHWLSNSEPGDVLVEIRRFARRRPFVFLASATLAGVVVGRLSRGLMAAAQSPETASPPARAAADVTNVPVRPPVGDLPAYGGGRSGQTYGYTPSGVPGTGEAGAGGDLR